MMKSWHARFVHCVQESSTGGYSTKLTLLVGVTFPISNQTDMQICNKNMLSSMKFELKILG
jgi:hypothetical protein